MSAASARRPAVVDAGPTGPAACPGQDRKTAARFEKIKIIEFSEREVVRGPGQVRRQISEHSSGENRFGPV
jgi:hypothetical protein